MKFKPHRSSNIIYAHNCFIYDNDLYYVSLYYEDKIVIFKYNGVYNGVDSWFHVSDHSHKLNDPIIQACELWRTLGIGMGLPVWEFLNKMFSPT